jgi:hypothetical protein
MEDYNFYKAREAWASPVKIVQYNCKCGRSMKFESEQGVIAPQREWVGLTDEEIADEFYKFESAGAWYQFTRAIEAKLKQKNT